MSAYRVFFLSAHGGGIGSHEFDAPRDAEATAVAGALADACSDSCDGFEVWQSGRRIARQTPLNSSIKRLLARMSDATRSAAVERAELIQKSSSRIAASKTLPTWLD